MKYIRKYTLESDWENDQQDREANVPVTSWLVDVDEVRYDHEEHGSTIVLTSTSNPEVFTILDEAGFGHEDPDGYTAAELGEITDADFYSSTLDSMNNTVYYSIFYNSDIETFDEFRYFTGITEVKHLAFSNCSNLYSIILPNSITAIYGRGQTGVTIDNVSISTGLLSPFGETSLTSITIPGSVVEFGDFVFYNCDGLTSVTIGNSVTSIGRFAFSFCYGLTSVTIPNSVTSISEYAFYNCTGLTSVTIPNSVTSIGGNAFDGCTRLTSVTIPNSVTSIANEAFYNCSGLTTVTIPNSVTSIGGSAFEGCSGLNIITSHATTAPTIYSHTFRNVKTGGTLHVPSGSNYSTWMQNANYYLGLYNWTIAYDA